MPLVLPANERRRIGELKVMKGIGFQPLASFIHETPQEKCIPKTPIVPKIEDQQKPAETIIHYISFNYIFRGSLKSSYALQPQDEDGDVSYTSSPLPPRGKTIAIGRKVTGEPEIQTSVQKM